MGFNSLTEPQLGLWYYLSPSSIPKWKYITFKGISIDFEITFSKHNFGSLFCKYIYKTTIDLYELNYNTNHYLQKKL